MLHWYPGVFTCSAYLSLDFAAWLDRLGISAVYVDGELVPVKFLTFTGQGVIPASDAVYLISTTRPLSFARLPRTLQGRGYRLATPQQYCRFLEVAEILGHELYLPRGHSLMLPSPRLVFRIGVDEKPIIPAAMILEPEDDCPCMQFFTLPHMPSVLDCSNYVLACRVGKAHALSP